MRSIIRQTTTALSLPDAAERAEAAANWGQQAANHRYQSQWPCLNTIEVAQPPLTAAFSVAVTVCAWNIERCKHVEASARLLNSCAADIVLATEMDWGMARSEQRHTTRELASALGLGYVFGVEFVELGLGDVRETKQYAAMSNLHGLHGNAILSRWPVQDVALIPLDEGGFWYLQAPKNDGQYRVGGRNAIAATIQTPAGPLLLVCVHYESESDAAGRAAQTVRLLGALDQVYGTLPAVIGGDLNTKGFLLAGVDSAAMLAQPQLIEPAFAEFSRYGFDWQGANTGAVTTRLHPDDPADRPLKTLDWLFTRQLKASHPFVKPALSASGAVLSDHELIGVQIQR